MITTTYAVRQEQLGTPEAVRVKLAALDAAARWVEGYRAVFLDGEECDGAAELCLLLAVLRDFETAGFRTHWTAPPSLLDQVPDWRMLTHLPVPDSGVDNSIRAEWRTLYRFGRLRWFKGPGFIKIHDQRCDAGIVFTLANPGHRDFAERASALGAFRADASWCDTGTLEALREAGVVLRLGEDCVWLAGRVGRWSHPSQLMAP